MRVLVDTSVWSEALRHAKRIESAASQELRMLILAHRVDIIGPIRQEILSGVRDKSQFDKLKKYLAAFPDLVLKTEDYITAASFFNACRAAGVQGSNTDYLLCAVAVNRQLAIYTTDKDFELFAGHVPIVLHKKR